MKLKLSYLIIICSTIFSTVLAIVGKGTEAIYAAFFVFFFSIIMAFFAAEFEKNRGE